MTISVTWQKTWAWSLVSELNHSHRTNEFYDFLPMITMLGEKTTSCQVRALANS